MAYESGRGTLDEMAATFEVDRRTVSRLLRRFREGYGLTPKPYGGGYPASLDDKHLGLLRRQVERKAGVEVHPSTVCRALQRLDLPRKKSLAAAEQVEADRRAFCRRIARLNRRRFVFTDETGFHLAMTRAYGRAARGERVNRSVPRNHGKEVTLLGSLGLRGLLAPLSLEGAVDTVAFDAYVSRILVSQLRPGDVVLFDNLPVHQASQVEAVVAEVEAEAMWLPAYSPDFSPIENCWSKVKALVRGRAPRTPKELNAALSDALAAVTLDDIKGWFRHWRILGALQMQSAIT